MINSLSFEDKDELNRIHALRFKFCLAFASGFSGINIIDGRIESINNMLKEKFT